MAVIPGAENPFSDVVGGLPISGGGASAVTGGAGAAFSGLPAVNVPSVSPPTPLSFLKSGAVIGGALGFAGSVITAVVQWNVAKKQLAAQKEAQREQKQMWQESFNFAKTEAEKKWDWQGEAKRYQRVEDFTNKMNGMLNTNLTLRNRIQNIFARR